MARKPYQFHVELAWTVNGQEQYAEHDTNAPTRDKAVENAIFVVLGKTSREARARCGLRVRVTDRWVKCLPPQPPAPVVKEKQLLLF